MISPLNARRLGALAATLALVGAACGSDAPDGAATSPSETGAPTTSDPIDSMPADSMPMDDMGMDDMGMSEMYMGDVNATPADDVEGAALARGEYVLLDTRPAGYDDVAGTAVIARSTHGTTVTTELTGLLPNVDYISHVHAQECTDDNAGPHYQFEVGGSTMPPNEIHLAFTSDNDGHGFMTAENHEIAGLDARAFVVHPAEFIDNKVACVDFIEDDPGAAAAAIATGVSHEMDDMDEDHDMSGDLGDLDVPALHEVDEQLAAGTLDVTAQLAVIEDNLASLDAVGENAGNEPLRSALEQLRNALEAEDIAAAGPLATTAHDLAHAMQEHDAEPSEDGVHADHDAEEVTE